MKAGFKFLGAVGVGFAGLLLLDYALKYLSVVHR